MSHRRAIEPAEVDLPDPATSPLVFLSHTALDEDLTASIARSLSTMGVRTWLFEAEITEGADIADSVREALDDVDCVVCVVTARSINSLWVLTELHTRVEGANRVALVLDTTDPLLVQLFETATYPHPDSMFDTSVECSDDLVEQMRRHYARLEVSSRVDRYGQVRDFLATVPYCLRLTDDAPAAWGPMYGFPWVPNDWSGAMRLESLSSLAESLNG
jgi:hypothetical protein